MKKAVILHGTNGNSQENWFPWLKSQLEQRDYEVWVPNLPNPKQPDEDVYQDFFDSSDYDFHDSLIIGHSSGAVAALKLLQKQPENVIAKKTILVGAFTEKLCENPDWAFLSGMFKVPFDFGAIRNHCRNFAFMHSEDDPYCPIEQAEYLHSQLGGQFKRFVDKKHFSLGTDSSMDKLPEILELVDENN